MSIYIFYNGELYHHGIKGQKWGIRRFQKKDGSLTPAGEKRYDDSAGKPRNKSKKKSKHRLRVEENFRAKGMSQKEAEVAASNRIRTEKIVTAAAGITVAACAAYVINNKIKERTDQVIKAGESLQRIERADTGGKLHKIFYTSKGKHDNARYEGLLGMTGYKQGKQAYKMKLEVQKDIKVASKDKAAKIFEQLYKTDDDFRENVEREVSKNVHYGNRVNTSKLSKRNMRKMYDNFNSNLVRIRGSEEANKFYDKLKSAGYGAIQDVNDMKFSGYNAKNPLIVFGGSDNVKVVSSIPISKFAADKKGKIELGKTRAESMIKKNAALVAGGLSVAAVGSYASDYSKNTNQSKVRNKK